MAELKELFIGDFVELKGGVKEGIRMYVVKVAVSGKNVNGEITNYRINLGDRSGESIVEDYTYRIKEGNANLVKVADIQKQY